MNESGDLKSTHEAIGEGIDVSIEDANMPFRLEHIEPSQEAFPEPVVSKQVQSLESDTRIVNNDDSGIADVEIDEHESSFTQFVKELQDQVSQADDYTANVTYRADDSLVVHQSTELEVADQDDTIEIAQEFPTQTSDQNDPATDIQLDYSQSPLYNTPAAEIEKRDLEIPTDANQPSDEDSGYSSSRKRVKLTVKQYKALKRGVRDTEGDERLAFERISPNSKFYRTTFDKEKDGVRRVLFPNAPKKRALFGAAIVSQRVEVIDSDDGNRDTAEDIRDTLCPEGNAEEDEPTTPQFDPLTPYRHVWKERDLILLYIVKRWYGNGPAGIRNVLNRCFGINISSGAYSMQFNEFFVKRKEKNLKIFRDVFIQTPFDDPEGKWARGKEELLAAAEGAGVELLARSEDDKEIIKAYEEVKKQEEVERMRSMLSAFVRKQPESPTLPPEDLEDDEIEPGMLFTPSKIRKSSAFELKKRKFGALSERSEAPKYKNRCYALPKHILFRYWDDESFGYNSNTLIRAGLFRDISEPVPEAPEMDTPDFDKHAANHINREKIPTPMISTSNSLMWVLRKAALSRRTATNPRIAVIEPAYLKKTFEVNEFISGLCKRQKMIKAAHKYGGHYDILVWGEIPKEAIVNVMGYFELLRATGVPRHIHVNFRLDIVSRPNIRGVVFGMKFAVVCAEELPRALSDFADIMLVGASAEGDLKARFMENAGIDWLLDHRHHNQNVSKYFLPLWSAADAERLLGLESRPVD
ncbi:hypothetical protein ABW21_db0206532 [Orbilia brochopaga]|nr:hypothetical protein ABW21_db0206532 [Drechslerella brochopaga]